MKIPYGKQHITQEDKERVLDVLGSELITQGNIVHEFEQAVADYHHAKYGVAFSNGTAALHAAYAVTGAKPGDEAISSPITFAASMNGALYCGLVPKFVDIDINTNCIDISKIEDAITDKTRVITPVSFAGYPVDLKSVREIADRHNCYVIHDAAHAIGSKFKGTFGMEYADMAILSFHPVKHITTGEGGMVLTNSKELNDKLRLFKSHGITKDPDLLEKEDGPWYYEMQSLGYNYRITEFQSALGLSQFSRIEENLKARNIIAKRYKEMLSVNSPVNVPPDLGFEILDKGNDAESIHAYHLFTVTAENEKERRRLYDYMRSKNIFVQIHYVPVHLHPYYRNKYGFKEGDFPLAEDFYSKEISIPMYHSMTEEEQQYVIDALKNF